MVEYCDEEGLCRNEELSGKFSKCRSAGAEIAESVEMRDEMTSCEAGCTLTRLADLLAEGALELDGSERPRRCLSGGWRWVRAGMAGPS